MTDKWFDYFNFDSYDEKFLKGVFLWIIKILYDKIYGFDINFKTN